MASKKREPSARVMKLLEQGAGATYEVHVAWVARTSQVSVGYLRVNGALLMHDQQVRTSPLIKTLDDAPQYEVEWSIAIEVPIDSIAIAVVNRSTGAVAPAGSDNKKKRGDTFDGSMLVDAP